MVKKTDYLVIEEDYDYKYIHGYFPDTTLTEVIKKLDHNHRYTIYTKEHLIEEYGSTEADSASLKLKKRIVEFEYNSGDKALSQQEVSDLIANNININSNYNGNYTVSIQDVVAEARSKLSKQEYEAFKQKVINENSKG